MPQLLLGGVIGWGSLLFAKRFLGIDLSQQDKNLHVLFLPGYLLVLLVRIYRSSFHTLAKIITGRINPEIVEISTPIKNDLYRCLLANSITLTPGTVTVDKKGDRLTVLWLDCTTRDEKEAGERIKGAIERRIPGNE